MSASSLFFICEIRQWYNVNKRSFPWRKTKDPYKVLIAEKLLQKTSASHAIIAYSSLIKKCPGIYSLWKMRLGVLKKLLKPLGLQQQRSIGLKKMAGELIERYGGKIPASKRDLLRVFGLGDYISDAVLCFGFGERTAVYDTNVRRVIGRFFFASDSNKIMSKIKAKFQNILPCKGFADFNWAVLDFGGMICKARPKCRICPLKIYCKYYTMRHPNPRRCLREQVLAIV